MNILKAGALITMITLFVSFFAQVGIMISNELIRILTGI